MGPEIVNYGTGIDEYVIFFWFGERINFIALTLFLLKENADSHFRLFKTSLAP